MILPLAGSALAIVLIVLYLSIYYILILDLRGSSYCSRRYLQLLLGV
jgi:hypothetical protein